MRRAVRTVRLLAVWLLLCVSVFSSAQTLVTTVPTGSNPVAVAVNPATNKIYVVNQNSNSVTVIDGATYNTATISVGASPNALAINPATNRIYVVNGSAATVTVIDGATNHTSSVSTGASPVAVAVNSATNKIYVANYYANSVTVIDGATNSTVNVSVGREPSAIAVNSSTNKIFIADDGSGDVAVIDGSTNLVTTVSAPGDPRAIAVDEFTNQIYVAEWETGSVAVIDGLSYTVTNVPVGPSPCALAVDPVRNQIIVANGGTNSGTIIDGVTLNTTFINAGTSPAAVGVDVVTGKAYFVDNLWSGTLTMFDEVGGSVSSIGTFPAALAINPLTNTAWVAVTYDDVAAVVAGGLSSPLQFVSVPPCRVVDTRQPQGHFGGPYLSGGTTRSFPLPQQPDCGIPASAAAYSLNVTVVPHARNLGYLSIWPSGELQPLVSTLNSPDGRVKANAAIVPAGSSGAVSVYVTDPTDVILDIDGYFQTPSSQTLQFYAVPPCRVFDTRGADGPLGGPHLSGGQERDFPVPASNCQLPSNALAYAMNFTVVPVSGKSLGYLTVWPAGSPQPVVSTLNNPTATVVANAAIVPAGVNGAIATYADQDTQLIGDIDGYFAAPASGGLSLYTLAPCRVIDTRSAGGAFNGQRIPPVNVAAAPCGIPGGAQEYVFNATVVPAGSLGYLTLWADPEPMPGISNLNATDGVTASNMALVGNVDGEVDAYAHGTTQLILDIASYLAP